MPDDHSDAVKLLWGERSQPSRGPKPALTAQRIAQAAIGIADAEGLGAVSIQRVAAEFGFTTMSLYRYVPSKTALIDLMVDAASGEPPDLSQIEGGWRPKLETWTRQCRQLFTRHPWLLQATPARRRIMGPKELAWFDSALGALAETGLSPAQRRHAFLALIGLVRAAAQQEHDSAGADSEREWESVMADLMQRHGSRYPALLEAIKAGMFATSNEDSLDFGLRTVLDGLESLTRSITNPAD